MLEDEHVEKFERFLSLVNIPGVSFYSGRLEGKVYIQAAIDFHAIINGLKVQCVGPYVFPEDWEMLNKAGALDLCRKTASRAFAALVKQNLSVGPHKPFADPAPIG